MECLPQNEDCSRGVLRKVSSVATVALNAATSGLFGTLSSASKGMPVGVKCGHQLFAAVNKVVGYLDEVENGGHADTTTDLLLVLLTKTDFAVYDLPVDMTTCVRLPPLVRHEQTNEVADPVKTIIGEAYCDQG